MHTLTVKQVPDALYESLKIRAKQNHRSLNKELIAILDEILSRQRVNPESFLSETEHLRSRSTKLLDDDLLHGYKNAGR